MPTLHNQATVADGRLLHYIERPAQNASAPALVFLHGWRSEAAVWSGIMRELPWSGAAYALDLPGFGQSPVLEKGAGLSDYAAVVEAFIEKKQLRTVIIVGHSFGGRIGIVIAARKPAWLHKLVLTGAAGVERSVKNGARRAVVQGIAKAVKPVFSPRFMQPARKRVYQLLGSEDYMATPHLTATFQAVINEDLTPLLPAISVPTLLLWGSDDMVTPRAYADIMEQNVPQSKRQVIANAGHYAFIDNPQAFAQQLYSFAHD